MYKRQLLTGADRQLHHGGAGQHRGAEHGVVGEPRVGRNGQPAGEDAAVALGEGERRAEHRVAGGGQAEPGRVHGDQVRGGRPVELVPERVGRQVGPLDRPFRLQGGPGDGRAGGVDPGQCGEERGDLVALAAHRGDGDACVRQVVGGHPGQHRVGAELQVAAGAERVEGVHRVGEPDRLPHLVDPVPRVAPLAGGDRAAGDAGDRGERGLPEGQPPHDRGETFRHRLHQPGVERVAGPQPGGLPATVLDGGDFLLEAGDDDRQRPVDRRDVEMGESFRHRGLGGLHGDHHATGRQGLHQPPPGDDQFRRVLQGEHPCGVRGGNLPDRVAGHDLGLQAERADGLQERDLHGEERRLGVPGDVDLLGLQHLAQGPVEVPVDGRGDGRERLGVPREPLGQPAAHGDPLRALAGEEEGELAGDRLAGDQAQAGLTDGQGGQPALQPVAVVGQDHRTVLQRGPAAGEDPGQVADPELRLVLEVGVELLGLRAQGVLAAGGKHHRHRGRALHRLVRDRRRRRLLDDQVGVGAADPERGDAGPARALAARPRVRLGEQLHLAGRPVDVRAGLRQVQRLRHALVPHREHGLHHAGDPGGGLGVTDVRLDRAEAGRAAGAVLAVRGEHRLRLDRVAQAGAGAVRLDHLDVVDGEPGVGERLPDDALL